VKNGTFFLVILKYFIYYDHHICCFHLETIQNNLHRFLFCFQNHYLLNFIAIKIHIFDMLQYFFSHYINDKMQFLKQDP
jgi:hypothetical protein